MTVNVIFPSCTLKDLEENMVYLVGDCLVAAAFMSYMGPFLSNYRDHLVKEVWLKEVRLTAMIKLANCIFTICNYI